MVTRIRQLLDWQQLSPTQFADLIGVGRPVVSHILSERNKPSLEVVQRIIAAFPAVSLSWLLSGSGAMLDGAAAGELAPSTLAARAAIQEEDQMPQPAPGLSAPAVAPPAVSSVTASVSQVASPAPIDSVAPPLPSAPYYSPIPVVAPVAPAKPAPARFMASRPQAAVAASPSPAAAAPQAPTAARTPVAAVLSPELPITDYPAAAPVAPAAPTAPPSVGAPAVGLPQPAATEAAALLPFLGEPGKAIRRIVIFYRDGSFADYQPEA